MQDSKNIKVAELTFKTMSYLGDWRPTSLRSFWAIRLYTLYSIIMLLNKFYFSISFFMNFYQNTHNVDLFIEGIFLFTTTFLTSFKILYINLHRQDVNCLTNMFSNKICLPRNNEEVIIHKKFQDKER